MCNPRYVCNTATTRINFAGAGTYLSVATQSSLKLWTQSWNTVLELMSADGPPCTVPANCQGLCGKVNPQPWEFIVHPSSTSLLWEDKHFSAKVLVNVISTITVTLYICFLLDWFGFGFFFNCNMNHAFYCLLQYKLQTLQQQKHLTRRAEFAVQGWSHPGKEAEGYKLQIFKI